MDAHLKKQRAARLAALLCGRGRRWLRALIGATLFCLGFVSCFGADAPVRKEHELKAAFLYNFTKFVEWPTNSFSDNNAPFVVAVAGESPCRAELDKIAKERKVNGRNLVIKSVTTPEAVAGAHALFIPATQDLRVKDWLDAVRNRNVLTVGESDLFRKHGGIINFLLEGEKICFEVNMDEANATPLKVSAQLQKLAKTVRRK